MISEYIAPHYKYLKYVLKHKWYVLVYGLKLGVPIWQLIVHDLSKFSRAEWKPYVHYFYKTQQWDKLSDIPTFALQWDNKWNVKSYVKIKFDHAWNHHQKRNPHHWQYWLLQNDQEGPVALNMPYEYIIEMIADWCSAGKCITGKLDVVAWYNKVGAHYIMSEYTRHEVESIIFNLDEYIKE